jgi:hypothetical protein
MRYRTVLSHYQGDPGFLSGIGKFVGGVARVAGGIIPGPIGALASAAGSVITRVSGGGVPASLPGGVPTASFAGQQPVPGIRGAAQRLFPGGATGYRKIRHMNPGNAKAARRAIRRVKSVRKLLQSIERELPRRPAARGGSRGVITRSEAARALRG